MHVLSDETCWRSLEHLVEHLPQQARMIVTTRSDPPLPLGRLRARGALGEIRARDLAFSVDEARELLVDREKIALDDADVELLVERTEGWPAGLYLAALWLRELDDPHAGVQAFHGNQRHVADYLTGEVLDRLDEDTRRFLLESSVLGSFSAPLCDAALDRSDSAARLRRLERENGFLVALDAHGEWYRYHHLFGELLQLELCDRGADCLRAAAHGERARGVASTAGSRTRSSTRRPRATRGWSPRSSPSEHRTLVRTGRVATLLRWCASLPEGLLVERPEIPVAAVLAAGLVGSPAHVRHRFVAVAERVRSERPDDWTPYHEAALGVGRLAWVEGDIGEAIERGRRAVAATRGVPEVAVPALASLGFLLFLNGDHAESRISCAGGARSSGGGRASARARPGARNAVNDRVGLGSAGGGGGESTGGDRGGDERGCRPSRPPVGRHGSRWRLRSPHEVSFARPSARRSRARGSGDARIRRPLISTRSSCWRASGRAAGSSSVRPQSSTRSGEGSRRSPMRARCPSSRRRVAKTLEKARATAALVSEEPTEAELNVLRLLSTDLSQREIGARLYLSVNTVKTHTRTLYRKLGVTSREACRRAGDSARSARRGGSPAVHPGDPGGALADGSLMSRVIPWTPCATASW